MNPAHLPTTELIASWPTFTPAQPLRVVFSACLAGRPCGVDGTTNGTYATAEALRSLPNVHVVHACPEEFSYGVPRETPDIQEGTGHDVLAGRARVLTPSGADWTDGMLAGARQMLRVATENQVHLAFLMDISAACGSQVIYNGPRHLKVYRQGPGVAAALLMEHHIPVVSQRDTRTLARIFHHLGADHLLPSGDGLDHHERPWFLATFPP